MCGVPASWGCHSLLRCEFVRPLSYDPGDTIGSFPCWSELSGVVFSGVGKDLAEDPVADLEYSYLDVPVVTPSDLLGMDHWSSFGSWASSALFCSGVDS